MNAGIDDQPCRAPDLVRQLAELLVRRLVDADLPAEPFGVQTPDLAVAREILFLAERRPFGSFERERGLEAVTWRALVQRQRRQRVERTRRQVVRVEHAVLRPAASP